MKYLNTLLVYITLAGCKKDAPPLSKFIRPD